MNILHVVDSWNLGGIGELVRNFQIHSQHQHNVKGYRGTMTSYLEEVGCQCWEGVPPETHNILIGHTVGGWSHENLFAWAKVRGMKTVECMHSIHASPTPPELVDAFVGMSNLATQANPQMTNRQTIYVIVNVDDFQREGSRNKIGKLCRLVAEKGPMEFVEIARAFPDEQFVLAGDGPLMGQIQAMRPPNLELLGMIRDFPAFYATLKLFVYPTKDECCSASVAMAMSAGVPIIVQNIPALKETTGDNAGFATTHDEFVSLVRYVLDHPKSGKLVAEGGLDWARDHFDVPVTIGVWDALVDKLVEK